MRKGLPRPPALPPGFRSDFRPPLRAREALQLGLRGHSNTSEWLSFHAADHAMVTARQSTRGEIWRSDPLSDPEVVHYISSLDPALFLSDAAGRGQARLAMQGMVPDKVRLRRSIGLQAADVSWWVRAKTSEYHDAIDQIAASHSATQFVDVAALRQSLSPATFADPTAMHAWQARYESVLVLGLFAAHVDAASLQQARQQTSN